MTYSGSRRRDRTGQTATRSTPRRAADGAGCAASDFAPASRPATSPWSSAARARSRTRRSTPRRGRRPASSIYNNVAGPLNGTLGSPGAEHPGHRHTAGDRPGARRASCGPGPVTLAREDGTESREAHDRQRHRRHRRAATRADASSSARTWTRVAAGPRHQRQRLRLGARSSRSPSSSPAAGHRADATRVRFMWWGAEELDLLGSTRYVRHPRRRGAGRHHGHPELRHGRLAELRPLRLRRRQLGVPGRPGRRAGPARLGP